MEQRKSKKIQYFNISIIRIVGLLCCFLLSIGVLNAKDKVTTKDTLLVLTKNLYNEDAYLIEENELMGNTIYLFKTDKTCISCYTALETYFNRKYAQHEVIIVAIIDDNPLLIDIQMNMINPFFKRKKEYQFLFYPQSNNEENAFIKYFKALPCPFFFIVNERGEVSYIPPEVALKIEG